MPEPDKTLSSPYIKLAKSMKNRERYANCVKTYLILSKLGTFQVKTHIIDRKFNILTLSSVGVGVQTEIRRRAPKAVYIHCAGHSLKLVISSCCGLPEIQNMISKVKEVCMFFNYSPKRNGFLSTVIKDQYPGNARKKPLSTRCVTTWAERSQAYEHLYESFEKVVYDA